MSLRKSKHKRAFSFNLGDLSVLNKEHITKGGKTHLNKLKDHINGPITIKLNEEQAKLLSSIMGDLVLKTFLDDYSTTTQEQRITMTNLEHNIMLAIQRAEKRGGK